MQRKYRVKRNTYQETVKSRSWFYAPDHEMELKMMPAL